MHHLDEGNKGDQEKGGQTVIEEDLRRLGVHEWRCVGEDRRKWKGGL